ncbi:Transducin-like enhancer protein 1, partial [Merops nubicus]
QTEIAKRLNVICAQLIPFLSQEHQQQVVQAVERAKQVTMTDLNAAIGVRPPSAHPFPTPPGRGAGLPQPMVMGAPVLPLSPELETHLASGTWGSGDCHKHPSMWGLLAVAQHVPPSLLLLLLCLHVATATERDPGPVSAFSFSCTIFPSSGTLGRARAISEYLSSSKKRKVEEKDFVTDYGSDADKSEDNLVVDEDPSSPHSVHSYSSRENGVEKVPLGRKEAVPLSPTSMASSSSTSPSRSKD